VRVGAREGEFRAEEEAVEEGLSLREKRPIVVLVVVVLEQNGEWDGGWTLDVGFIAGPTFGGEGGRRLEVERLSAE
jgi:hypothetical protein